MSSQLLKLENYGEQEDGSIIDIYGNVISYENRIEILDGIQQLPVSQYKGQVLDLIGNNKVSIIQAETGSGKTTQVGKLLGLDGNFGKIITTQSRRIAAISGAGRTSVEMICETGDINYSVGKKVGYRVGNDVSSKHTSDISFHTDGLELMRQLYSGLYPNVLILDEIHGFGIPTELIASHIRNRLIKNDLDLKLVLMSATINPGILQEYFKDFSKDIPVLSIPGRTYPVDKYYNTKGNYIKAIETLINSDDSDKKNILLFVEGKKEIYNHIEIFKQKFGDNVVIYPLHSEIPTYEQLKVLNKTSNKPHLIISTNIAEESITIDYIDAVIDLGLEKTSFFNDYGIEELKTINISKANSDQRAGRAGRTHDGYYARHNDESFEDILDYPIAPIEKERLDRYILLYLSRGIDIFSNKNKLFIHNPSIKLLKSSYEDLKAIGAISKENKITQLGIDILKFPLGVFNSRALLESINNDCSTNIALIASIIEKKSFLSTENKKWELLLTDINETSDFDNIITLFNILTQTSIDNKLYNNLKKLGASELELDHFMGLDGSKKLFEVVGLESLGINSKRVFEIYDFYNILLERLSLLGISPTFSDDKVKIYSCLLKGYPKNLFCYKDGFYEYYKHDIPLNFKKSNISHVENDKKSLYFGLPFIISPLGKPSINLLTNLVEFSKDEINSIDDGDYISRIGGDIVSQNDEKNEISSELSHISNKNKSVGHLAKNWLPLFLVENNKSFKKLLKQNKLEKNTLIELLKKHTVKFKDRINLDKIDQTIHSFIYDTAVYESFIGDTTPIIGKFLNGQKIENSTINNQENIEQNTVMPTKKDVEEILSTDSTELSLDLLNLKNEFYLTCEGFNKSDIIDDLPSLKKTVLSNIFASLIDDIKLINIDNSIMVLTNDLDKKNGSIKKLKSVNKKLNLINKYEHYNKKLVSLLNKLNLIFTQGREIDIEKDLMYFIKDEFILGKVLHAISLVLSLDKRKNKRGLRLLQGVIDDFSKLYKRYNLFIDELKQEINFHNENDIRSFIINLETFLQSFYTDKDFYYINIKPKLYQLSINLINSFNKGESDKQILINFMLNKDTSVLTTDSNIFKYINELESLEYDRFTYKEYVIKGIEESLDMDYIMKMTDIIKKLKSDYYDCETKIKTILEK